jgi:sodium ion-translocating decarboxylase beta subunit
MTLNEIFDMLKGIFFTTGLCYFSWKYLIMWAVAGLFMYLAIKRNFEPLLLLPIGFGIFVVNFPLVPLMGHTPEGHGQLIRIFYHYGLEGEVIPCLIFLGLGAMTDFGPLIANPKTLLIGAGAQLGVFVTFTGTVLAGFTLKEAASVGIIGGADGPTTIYLTQHLAPQLLAPQLLAPQLLGANALAAYSYMAMVPLIQPPIMRWLTNDKERKIRMWQLRPVSKTEKIFYPLVCVTVIAILVPSVIPLMGMFMLGNLMKESGVVARLTDTAQNALMNMVTIFLGISLGATV